MQFVTNSLINKGRFVCTDGDNVIVVFGDSFHGFNRQGFIFVALHV